jgi:hypothetical protein
MVCPAHAQRRTPDTHSLLAVALALGVAPAADCTAWTCPPRQGGRRSPAAPAVGSACQTTWSLPRGALDLDGNALPTEWQTQFFLFGPRARRSA